MKTLRYLILTGAVLAMPMLSVQGFAQEQGESQAEMSVEAAEVAETEKDGEKTTGGSDYQARLALSKEMHEIRPAAEQVNNAIDSVALKMPESARNDFKTKMRNFLNYRAIERISINAMAETYTLEELEAMVEYYSKPEAQSAVEKTSEYQQKVQPEIVRMIDRAVMQMRTGNAN